MTPPNDRLDAVARGLLRPLNQAAAKTALADLKTIGKRQAAVAALIDGDTPLRDFIVAVFTLSPYLHDTAELDPALLAAAIGAPLVPQIERLIDAARQAWLPAADAAAVSEGELMGRLRRIKRKAAFLIALADLSRLFDARTSARLLSALAEASISAAIDHLLLSAHEAGKLVLKDAANPAPAPA
ncbi:MAG: hypothetical protein PW844_07190 [Pantoea sp.]|uniref:hypothetical protein n=1 Tax=Pantoea sp. TaxID=69393 RepID=UPI002387626E|nr:hypothetical protein [Pantoea sp.]MDE1186246.1 hypothetical protein [Pantoea sp.]